LNRLNVFAFSIIVRLAIISLDEVKKRLRTALAKYMAVFDEDN